MRKRVKISLYFLFHIKAMPLLLPVLSTTKLLSNPNLFRIASFLSLLHLVSIRKIKCGSFYLTRRWSSWVVRGFTSPSNSNIRYSFLLAGLLSSLYESYLLVNPSMRVVFYSFNRNHLLFLFLNNTLLIRACKYLVS